MSSESVVQSIENTFNNKNNSISKKSLNDTLQELEVKLVQIDELKSLVQKAIEQLKAEKFEHDRLIALARAKLPAEIADSEIVEFNVGGQIFTTYRSTLTKRVRKSHAGPINDNSNTDDNFYEPHLLQSLVSGLVEVKRDKNNAIFIDRSPRFFDLVLDYLRQAGSGNDKEEFDLPFCEQDLAALMKEAEYYNIQGLIELGGRISPSQVAPKPLFDDLVKLCSFPPALKWNLLYRGTRDGFGADDFHEKCDGKGRNIVVVKSRNGNVFGGYTSVSWDSVSKYKSDPNAFLFSLVNKTNSPVKINIGSIGGAEAICCSGECGPTFGAGPDLYIQSHGNTGEHNFSNLGRTYANANYRYGASESKLLMTGTYKFQVDEVEVFALSN
jgi:hypothetical protein